MEGGDGRRSPPERTVALRHHRRRGPFRGSASDRSRGAVLVEAAFVTPVFLALVLGVMEIGLAMNDNLALAHTVRAGSRVASASGDDPFADYGIIQAVKRESAALPRAQVDLVVVYKASAFGQDPTAACKAGNDVTGVCNAYTPADFSKPKDRWACLSSESLDKAWCPTTRKVSRSGAGPDYVGVWMKIRHPWLTRMFGATLTLTDASVIRLEPRLK